jgi:hypothetical protein
MSPPEDQPSLERVPSRFIEAERGRMLPDGRLDRVNAAKYLGRKPKTLAMWAMQGKDPRTHNVGGRLFYYLAELEAFVAAEDQMPSAGPPGPDAQHRRSGPRGRPRQPR